jgi:hypothetical protein
MGVVSELTSWRDGPATQAIVAFVARAAGEDGSAPVSVEDRLAVFDNDGTLWCESRCSTASCAGSSTWLRRTPGCASASPGRPPTSATTPGSAS